jgi:RNA recognition motif-containing protein
MQIYVGNIAYAVDEEILGKLFGKFGKVTKIKIMNDSLTGENRHWGMVTMENKEEGEKAVKCLNLKEVRGRKIKVNKYRPKSSFSKRPKFGEWRQF